MRLLLQNVHSPNTFPFDEHKMCTHTAHSSFSFLMELYKTCVDKAIKEKKPLVVFFNLQGQKCEDML